MTTFILTEGGKGIGFGHIARCSAIYQAFEERGVVPMLLVRGDETVRDALLDKKYVLGDWAADEKSLAKMVEGSDIVLVDSYLAGSHLYEMLSRSAGQPVYLDDTKRISYPRGMVVNAAISAKDLHYPTRDGVEYLLGLDYVTLRKEFWRVPEIDVKPGLERMLITMGGSDEGDLTPRLLRFLNEAYPEMVKNVVIGKGFRNREAIERLATKKTSFVYGADAITMRDLMIGSDIALSAGGQTLCELARVGLATAAIAVAENQVNHVKGWGDAGFVEYGGWGEDADLLERVGGCIDKLKDIDVRRSKYRAGRSQVDGMGSLRLVDRLLRGPNKVTGIKNA